MLIAEPTRPLAAETVEAVQPPACRDAYVEAKPVREVVKSHSLLNEYRPSKNLFTLITGQLMMGVLTIGSALVYLFSKPSLETLGITLVMIMFVLVRILTNPVLLMRDPIALAYQLKMLTWTYSVPMQAVERVEAVDTLMFHSLWQFWQVLQIRGFYTEGLLQNRGVRIYTKRPYKDICFSPEIGAERFIQEHEQASKARASVDPESTRDARSTAEFPM